MTAVQSSGHVLSLQVPVEYSTLKRQAGGRYVILDRGSPSLIMGSMVKVCPGFMMPTALFLE